MGPKRNKTLFDKGQKFSHCKQSFELLAFTACISFGFEDPIEAAKFLAPVGIIQDDGTTV